MANRLSLLMKITTSERQWSEVKQKSTGHGKVQLISKADWRAIDSPKIQKRTDEFVLFTFTLHGKQIKFVRLFFGRI